MSKKDKLNKREVDLIESWADENRELFAQLEEKAKTSPGVNGCNINYILAQAGFNLKLETSPLTLRDLLMYFRGECVVV